MKLRSILAASVGLSLLAGAQLASAGTLLVLGDATTGVDQYYNDGGQSFTIRSFMTGGSMTFTDGNGTQPGSAIFVGHSSAGNSQLLNPVNVSAGVVNAVANDNIVSSFAFTVGVNDRWNINRILAGPSYVNQAIPGLQIGDLVDVDRSAPSTNLVGTSLQGYTGMSQVYYAGGAPNTLNTNMVTVGPTCNGQNGCLGDMNQLLRPDAMGDTNYGSLYYWGFDEVFNSLTNSFDTRQIFRLFGQGAFLEHQIHAHNSVQGVKLYYVSGSLPAGGTPIPEPMTMSLLGGALGVGALRRRFKKA